MQQQDEDAKSTATSALVQQLKAGQISKSELFERLSELEKSEGPGQPDEGGGLELPDTEAPRHTTSEMWRIVFVLLTRGGRTEQMQPGNPFKVFSNMLSQWDAGKWPSNEYEYLSELDKTFEYYQLPPHPLQPWTALLHRHFPQATKIAVLTVALALNRVRAEVVLGDVLERVLSFTGRDFFDPPCEAA